MLLDANLTWIHLIVLVMDFFQKFLNLFRFTDYLESFFGLLKRVEIHKRHMKYLILIRYHTFELLQNFGIDKISIFKVYIHTIPFLITFSKPEEICWILLIIDC